jgi:autophagy-related protein 18
MICELLFPSTILSVKMNRKTLVVVLEVEIYIYDISNMKLLHVIETSPNPEGESLTVFYHSCSYFDAAICALSSSSDSSYLVYPSPVPSPQSPLANASPSSSDPGSLSGDVLIFSTRTLTVTNVVRAHKSPISALAINSTGTVLATASNKGTVIRIWSLPGAEKLYQFRRGTREAKIWSMCFNATSTLLGVVGDSGTVHIFKLGLGKESSNGSHEVSASSPAGSFDSRDNSGGGGMEGGYEAFIDGKKKRSMGWVYLTLSVVILMLFADLYWGEGRYSSLRASHRQWAVTCRIRSVRCGSQPGTLHGARYHCLRGVG